MKRTFTPFGVTVLAVALVITWGLPTAASARITAGDYEMSVMVGPYIFDDMEEAGDYDDGPVYTYGLGYHLTDHFGAEITANYIDTEVTGDDGTPDAVYEHLYRLDFLYHFAPDRTMVPYFLLGGGLSTIHADDKETGPVANYGLGFKYFLSDRVAFRADARHLFYVDDESNHFSCQVGLTLVLGEDAAEKPRRTTAAGTRDSDGDGVPDHLDQCSATPRGLAVDGIGCPKPISRPSAADSGDASGGTTPARRTGDARTGTATAAPSAEMSPSPVRLLIEFGYNQSRIDTDYRKPMRQIADYMAAHPGTRAVIEGHTDSTGSETYNATLSRKRAEAVKEYLTRTLGIADSRLDLQWYGESSPIADNSTDEGRQRNRRVLTITIVE
jgi:OmpA-OmpF porin, OOP family